MSLQLLLNNSFEAGLVPWVPVTTGGGTVTVTPGAAGVASEKAHAGSFFVLLAAPGAGATASISQTVFLPLLPGSNLRLSFFARRATSGAAAEDTLTAFIDLVTVFGTIITTTILVSPPAAAPVNSNSVYEYYEVFSPPIPLGIIGATARITLGITPARTSYAVDDVNLYYNVG